MMWLNESSAFVGDKSLCPKEPHPSVVSKLLPVLPSRKSHARSASFPFQLCLQASKLKGSNRANMHELHGHYVIPCLTEDHTQNTMMEAQFGWRRSLSVVLKHFDWFSIFTNTLDEGKESKLVKCSFDKSQEVALISQQAERRFKDI